ncbi:hypothetical protein KL941_004105 [Ogataea angusta]|nr:hypothetical protein KL941_004105 [Ogataea angusta]
MATFTDPLDSITDPSDWADTSFPNLSKLDSLLRCHICKDFLRAPVLTSCDHVFCSVCIRRSLESDKKCPLCHEETYESKLRKVLLLDEISTWFTRNRPELLDKHRPTANNTPEPVAVPEPEKPAVPLRYESRKKRAAEDPLVECPAEPEPAGDFQFFQERAHAPDTARVREKEVQNHQLGPDHIHQQAQGKAQSLEPSDKRDAAPDGDPHEGVHQHVQREPGLGKPRRRPRADQPAHEMGRNVLAEQNGGRRRGGRRTVAQEVQDGVRRADQTGQGQHEPHEYQTR